MSLRFDFSSSDTVIRRLYELVKNVRQVEMQRMAVENDSWSIFRTMHVKKGNETAQDDEKTFDQSARIRTKPDQKE